jgi:hypothetical protein
MRHWTTRPRHDVGQAQHFNDQNPANQAVVIYLEIVKKRARRPPLLYQIATILEAVLNFAGKLYQRDGQNWP